MRTDPLPMHAQINLKYQLPRTDPLPTFSDPLPTLLTLCLLCLNTNFLGLTLCL